MPQLRISVVMPCYNVEEFVAETLTSVLAQSLAPSEVLVINDGSTDGTKEALAAFDEQIIYLETANTGGPSRPRNYGLENATGDLIAFFDSDDLMLPGKLAAAADVFASRSDVDFLFTNFQKIDEQGNVVLADFLAEYQEFRRYLAPVNGTRLSLLHGPDAYRSLLRANFIGTSSVICRRAVFDAVGNFDETMPNSEDVDLWRRIARAGHTFALLDDVYHGYRIRSGSVSRGGSKLYPAWIKAAEKEIPYCSDPQDIQYLADKVQRMWLGYGYNLRIEGDVVGARSAFRTALRRKISWGGIRGLALTYWPGRRP